MAALMWLLRKEVKFLKNAFYEHCNKIVPMVVHCVEDLKSKRDEHSEGHHC